MPKNITFTCDGCGAIRKESNHWWTVVYRPKENEDWNIRLGAIIKWPMGLLITPFQDMEEAQHYCGQACLLKRVSEFTSGKTPHRMSTSCQCAECVSLRSQTSDSTAVNFPGPHPVQCPHGRHPIFVRPSGYIVAHNNECGKRCTASEIMYPANAGTSLQCETEDTVFGRCVRSRKHAGSHARDGVEWND